MNVGNREQKLFGEMFNGLCDPLHALRLFGSVSSIHRVWIGCSHKTLHYRPKCARLRGYLSTPARRTKLRIAMQDPNQLSTSTDRQNSYRLRIPPVVEKQCLSMIFRIRMN